MAVPDTATEMDDMQSFHQWFGVKNKIESDEIL